MYEEQSHARVVLVVPKQHVKTVKSSLERFGQLDRYCKITPEQEGRSSGDTITPNASSIPEGPSGDPVKFPVLEFDVVSGKYVVPRERERAQQGVLLDKQRMRVPTTIPYPWVLHEASGPLDDREAHEFKSKMLKDLVLSYLFQDISISYQNSDATSEAPSVIRSPVQLALKQALDALPESALLSLGLTTRELVSSFPDGYSVYKPMLLLPHNAFTSPPWRTLLSTHPADSQLLKPLWQHIASAVDTTHIAINSPIPSTTTSTQQENILRSPLHLTPLHGSFGPPPTPVTLSSPTASDFRDALWVTTTQNGIHQTWAPLYTMFSRGNMREKTRILHLPSVAASFDVPSAAVDLYAGIGYFAFSYRKSGQGRQNGVARVLCWEINPWSVEGLRRGAKMNGWSCRIITLEESNIASNSGVGEEDFWVFQMSNEDAERSDALMGTGARPKLPVRHVNLGLLPTSKLAWGTAVGMLDEGRGGWIHAHENVGVKDIDARTKEVEGEFQRLVDDLKGMGKGSVKVEHVERVKMYAPGVVHVVFDVHIGGR
ncbi:hypothetical protein EJ02DRAFT_339171 [Clathrospora elynae]|uniref:tRNA(Phe) (4-demethylwyosine(37)-C(7)) aminocarboxypropyltransferase n=1 Tax=Clathrospora elynae TaxID=706981 RepID=A0A6A5SZ17_9PLEO|nr:hypothetical protein EJ02DRAFT_339171 [Clathrospora elynae]